MPDEIEIEKKIDAYVKGNLSEEEAKEFWEELLLHPEYIDLLETELGLKEVYGKGNASKGKEVEKGSVYSINISWKWVAAAASVAILVVAINFLQMNTNPPVHELAINSIDLTASLASVPVVRSEQASLSSEDSLLNKGVETSLDGENDESMQFYREIIEQYPNSSAASKALINLGIMQYNLNRYDQAVDSFSEGLKIISGDSLLKERAYWYMGNAYIKQGKLKSARRAISRAYNLNGEFRDPAYKLMQKLDYELRKNNAAQIN